jgi:AAA family ATP:ADP antiporter
MLVLGAALSLARIGRDALFFQQGGLTSLPLALAGAALLAVPMAVLLLALSRRHGVQRTRLVALAGAAAVFALVAVIGRPGGGPAMTAFFMLVPVLFGGIFSLSWLLVGELAPPGGAARTFSRAGAATLLGGVMGAGLASPVATLITPRGLLGVSALLLVGAALLTMRASRGVGAPDTPRRTAISTAGFGMALSQPYVRVLLRVAVLAAAVGVGVEYQFYRAASHGAPDARLATFANVYLAINLFAFLMQWLLLPHLQRRVGLGGVLLILPLGLLGLLPLLALNGTTGLQGVLRLAEGGLKLSTYRAGWEQSYLPIAVQCRTEAKLLVDGVGGRVAEAMGAAGVCVWMALVAPRLGGREPLMFLVVLAVIAAAWAGSVVRAGRHFDSPVVDPHLGVLDAATVPPHG